MSTCPRCLMSFPHHFVVEARCVKRWRGTNFHARQAEADVASAVAERLGLSVRTTEDLERFLTRAFVRAYGAGADPNPTETFDPAVGERYEFHIGLRDAIAAQQASDIEQAATDTVSRARGFRLA